jgi:hypothetical protein
VVQDGQLQQQPQQQHVGDAAAADGPAGRTPLQENRTQQQVLPPMAQQHPTAEKAVGRNASAGFDAEGR